MLSSMSLTCVSLVVAVMMITTTNVVAVETFNEAGYDALYGGEEKEKAEKYIEEVISKVGELSPTANTKQNVINGQTTDVISAVKTWIKNDFNRRDKDQVGLVIILENYSEYTLADPQTSGNQNCHKNKEVIPPEQTNPRQYSVIAFDNEAYSHYGSCGSLSWQILGPNSKQPVVGSRDERPNIGRRLNIAFNTYYAGSCSYFPPKKRSDGHRIVVLQNELDEKNNWKTPSLQGEQGFRFLQPIRGEGGIERHDRRGSNYKYIVKTKYERPEHRKGCNPILRVQFMASKEYKHDNVGIDKPMPGQIKMWMYIGFGLGGFALLVMFWVLCNQIEQRKKGKTYSKNYGATRKTKGHKDSRRGEDDDSDDVEQMMAIQPSKVLGNIREYHDRVESEEEYNSNNNQRTLPKKIFRE